MAQNLSNLVTPPKLAGLDNGQGPTTISDWLSIYRFLISLWRKAENSTTDQQVIAFGQSSGNAHLDIESLPFVMARPVTHPGPDPLDTALAVMRPQLPVMDAREVTDFVRLSRPQLPAIPQADTFGLALTQFARPPYPTPPPPSPSLASYANLIGPHSDRLSQGNGTVAGNTLTRSTGPTFAAYWAGNRIGIGNNVYSITSWVDANNVIVNGTPPTGAVLWQMEYFAPENYPVGRFLFETDRTSLYYNGGTNGTGNLSHFTFSWVSGPFFSPYMVGLPITINGVGYTIATATQGTITLTVDSGLVTTGLAWGVADSAWIYATGRYDAGTANKPTDLNCYTDVGFLFHDENRDILYWAVRDLAFSTSVPYFAWFDGMESMTWATFGGRTFRASDAGYLITITDYAHLIKYDGTNWAFAGSDDGSGYIVMYGPTVAGSLAYFVFCNGSAYNIFSISAGVPVILSITTPDMTSNDFVRGATYTGVVSPTTAPTVAVGTLAASTESATHTHNTAASTSATESAAHQHPFGATANAQPYATGIPVVSAINIASENATHTHVTAISTSTTESATHTHTITGAPTVSAPTVGAGAPASMALAFYMRI